MKRLLAALAVAVVARMAFHAVFLPAFEGPDEPHHLARVLAFARGPITEGFAGRSVGPEVVAAVRAYPCAPALATVYGCPAFGTVPGGFDLVRTPPEPAAAGPLANPESNQPPLSYLVAGLALRLSRPGISPAAALLACRLLAVACVAFAIFGPLARLARARPPALAVAALLALLLPGASESLARCSNDAAVFLWAALVLAMLDADPPPWWAVLLIAVGPLLKLTAIPIVVFATVALFARGRRATAAASAACALVVFPVQLARGWMWGGTIELNHATATIAEPVPQALAGFLRSAYAFVKTTFWVGGWSFLRPPLPLALLYLALLAAAAIAWRPKPHPARVAAHAAGLACAAVGFCVFALANRRYYGVWGGVAGWYLWGWSPWLAAAADDLGSIGTRAAKPLLFAEAAFVVAANAVWLSAHGRLYGW